MMILLNFLIKFIHSYGVITFYLTSMLLRLLVVVDAHEENVAGVVGNLRGIILALDLVDGSVGGMIEFQFNDECRLADVAAGNHHEVGITLAMMNL